MSDGHIEIRLKLLDRYVMREYLVSYLISIVVVLSLRILLDLFVELDEFVESDADAAAPGAVAVLRLILDYYGPKTLEYFRDFSGVIIMIAACFSLARMMRQNELTGVLASGVSLKRVIAPIVLLAVGLNVLTVLDQEFVLPRLADKLIREHDEVAQAKMIRVWLLPDDNEALLSTPRFDYETGTMYDMHVILRAQGSVIGQITADQAQWDGKKWVLQNGFLLDNRLDGLDADHEPSKTITEYKSALSAEYLWLQRNANHKSLMSAGELDRLLERKLADAQRREDRGYEKNAEYREAISEKHFRFTDPIINMVMLLLGLPLLVSRERRSTKTAIFLALLGSGGCFVTTFMCKLLAGGAIDPLIAAWLPIVVFLPLSVLAFDGLKT